MKIKKINFEELNELELKNISGGGEPVPGAEIYVEITEPDDEPIINKLRGTIK